jgi:hypothetical protein
MGIGFDRHHRRVSNRPVGSDLGVMFMRFRVVSHYRMPMLMMGEVCLVSVMRLVGMVRWVAVVRLMAVGLMLGVVFFGGLGRLRPAQLDHKEAQNAACQKQDNHPFGVQERLPLEQGESA